MLKETVTIAGMPNIWSSEIMFFAGDVTASFAKWAVSQSPYVVPDNLDMAIKAVDEYVNTWVDGIITMTCNAVCKRLEEFFEKTPVIEIWNHPKSGNERLFYGADRHGNWQEPDDDIIDLHALARNIAHDLTLWNVYKRAHRGGG